MSRVNVRGAGETVPRDPEELIRAARSAAVGDLVPGLVHELNNPLLAILGLVDLLAADTDPASQAHRRLGVVRETAVEMRTLLRALRDFARAPEEPNGHVDLGAAALETIALVRRTSSATDIDVALDLPPEPLLVPGSRDEIRQAVLHLLTNAFTALANGGAVSVSVARRGAAVALTVADSGPGVGAGLEDRIFEPFFSTRPGHGGLGLTAARAIAERHGGSLDLARSTNRGAVFVLTLAAAETPGT